MIRRLVAPLVSATTYRRGAFLLLGAALLLPYGIVAVGLARVAREGRTPLALLLALVAVSAVIGLAPPFLHGARVLEVAAARWLLGVELPDPPERPAPEARLRGALWFAVHLGVGSVVGLALFAAVPSAAMLIVAHSGWQAAGLGLLGIALLIATVYATAGMGALAALMAPVLLGPSADERVAAVRAEARRLAERNRLARDLHDSVGHALTVTVLQATAAGELFDRDPAFARRALTAIEETGRAAMEDLDQMLGRLRDERDGPVRRSPAPETGDRTPVRHPQDDLKLAPDRPVPAAGRPDLGDLRWLAAGAGAEMMISGALADVPAELSREAYRVVQESLTNALRHAAPAPVALRVIAGGPALVVEVRNPLPGRGLAGMRERVALLGGELVAGPDGDQWRVRAEWHW
jgi:signal transduction histidine kinase